MFPSKSSAKITQAAALSAMLLLAACGGGGGGARQSPTQVDPESTPAPTPAPEPPIEVRLDTATTPLVEGRSNSQRAWPTGSAANGRPIDGVGCLVNENYHIHSLVSIYRDGVRLGIPTNIGLQGCAYELHTHDWTGVIHVETDVQKTFTLGQFFSLWGKDLSRTSVAGIAGPVRYYIIENGNLTPVSGDPRTIQFSAHREILILTGRSPGVVPKYAWPAGI